MMLTVPPVLVVRLLKAVLPPTLALNKVAPVVSTARAWPPLTVPVKVTSPEPVLTMVAPAKVVVPATPKALLVVV